MTFKVWAGIRLLQRVLLWLGYAIVAALWLALVFTGVES